MTRFSASLADLSTYLQGTRELKGDGLRLAALIGLLFLNAPALQAQTPNVIATWNANTESDIAGYVLSYGTQTGNYSTHVDVANTTTWQGSLAPGVYYFAQINLNNGDTVEIADDWYKADGKTPLWDANHNPINGPATASGRCRGK